jgi:hypothetical protein
MTAGLLGESFCSETSAAKPATLPILRTIPNPASGLKRPVAVETSSTIATSTRSVATPSIGADDEEPRKYPKLAGLDCLLN